MTSAIPVRAMSTTTKVVLARKGSWAGLSREILSKLPVDPMQKGMSLFIIIECWSLRIFFLDLRGSLSSYMLICILKGFWRLKNEHEHRGSSVTDSSAVRPRPHSARGPSPPV